MAGLRISGQLDFWHVETMSKNPDLYTYQVTFSKADREFVGLCLEFPSLSWLADTPEAALNGIRQLVCESTTDLEARSKAIQKPLEPLRKKRLEALDELVSLDQDLGFY